MLENVKRPGSEARTAKCCSWLSFLPFPKRHPILGALGQPRGRGWICSEGWEEFTRGNWKEGGVKNGIEKMRFDKYTWQGNTAKRRGGLERTNSLTPKPQFRKTRVQVCALPPISTVCST